MKLMNLLFKDRSLGYKFLVLPTIPVMVVVVFISANILMSQKRILVEKAKKRASLLTELSILTVSNEFVMYNKNLLDNIVDNLSTDTSVVYAVIVDSSDNRILSHSDHGYDGTILNHDAILYFTTSHEHGDFYEISDDINVSGNKCGVLNVGFSLEDVYQEISQMKQRFLLIAFTAVALGAFFSIILARLISIPIKALVEQTKIIGAGNLENKIIYRSKDILGQLANEFNKMVSSLKAKQQQIVDNEGRLLNLVENMPVMMDALDEDFNIVVWNRECERVTGYRASELVGNPNAMKILYPDDEYRERVISEFLAMGLNFRENEYKLTCKDGTQRIISWSNISAQHPVSGWYTWAIGVDITEHRQAQEALRDSEEKYRLIMTSMNDTAYIVSSDFRIEYLNPRMINNIGRDATGEVCHKAIYDRETRCSWCALERILQGETYCEYELINPRNNNVYSVTNSPMRHTDGTISNLAILRNITEKRAIEAQLRQSQKMESIGTLAGGIAHDFNNVLYMILGNTELALEDISNRDPVYKKLEGIKSAALRASGIVRQLLDFSRKIDRELKPVNAVFVIKDSLTFLRSIIPASVEIRRHLPDTDISILGDPIQINQVMMNLCTNASQAMEETGGILEITVKEVYLNEDAVEYYSDLHTGDYLQITVSDTGHGVEPEIIDRIFDPYFTTKEVGKGSGLGLAVVHGIVKNYNGAVSVDSRPGNGTTFTILVPVVAEKPVTEAEQTDEISRGNETILFVDDEKAITDITGTMLKRLGYKTEIKNDPAEALELFRSKPHMFDLVITDMTMPHMSGIKLSKELKEIRPDIPVIVCTGHSPFIDEEKAKSLNIAAYIMKPVRMRDIAKAIRRVLDT